MKLFVVIALIVLAGVACKPAPKIYSSQITNINRTEEGTIFIKCSGKGRDKEAAYENAIYNAFSTLLFQGIPESVQTRPMIDPANANAAKPKVEKCITDNGCYKQFITQITEPGAFSKVEGGFATVTNIKINIVALRTYLEQNNIIRKFGL